MRDVKGDALRMLESGTPIAVVARWSGTTEAQIREWKEEGTRPPVLKMLHEGKTPSEIARALGGSRELRAHGSGGVRALELQPDHALGR